MKNYKYKYIVTPTKVIALSTYAGRPVRGIAKCHPNDTFDVEYGKALAAARCNEKIARKRYARATKKYNELVAEIEAFNKRAAEVADYLHNSSTGVTEAIARLKEVETYGI